MSLFQLASKITPVELDIICCRALTARETECCHATADGCNRSISISIPIATARQCRPAEYLVAGNGVLLEVCRDSPVHVHCYAMVVGITIAPADETETGVGGCRDADSGTLVIVISTTRGGRTAVGRVTVEGELGVLAGVEDEVSAEHHTYTDPEEVIDFATRTGCDSLAISIGTSHGAYKFKPEQCHVDPATGRLVPPPLAFDVLDAVMKKLPGFPIVLHGSSSVPQEEVDTINKYGGKLEAAIGIPEEELRKAAKSAVCKINIDSDSRLAMTAAIRKVFAEKPAEFDPRKYLGPARDNMEKLYKHKIVNVLGSNDKL